MKKVLIGGIGNVLLSDDGVGPYVVRILAAHYEFEEGVAVEDMGTPALDLIDQISGKDAVILIDSILGDAAPGTVFLYRKSDIIRHCPAVRMDPHSPAIVDTLHNVELFAHAPEEVLLIGIVGEGYDSGCSLSAPVAASCTRVVEEVLRELDRLGVSWQERKVPLDPGIWWTPVDELEHRMTGDRLSQDANRITS
jgi:hydrogenase maturation protease